MTLKQYERDEHLALIGIVTSMNNLHANMGGRDTRPERVALLRCMRILRKEIDRSIREA